MSEVFYKKILNRLPFYFRFHNFTKLRKERESESENRASTSTSRIGKFEVYSSNASFSNLPPKPISKLLSYEDQEKEI